MESKKYHHNLHSYLDYAKHAHIGRFFYHEQNLLI